MSQKTNQPGKFLGSLNAFPVLRLFFLLLVAATAIIIFIFSCEVAVRVFKVDIPPKSAFVIKIPAKWKTLTVTGSEMIPNGTFASNITGWTNKSVGSGSSIAHSTNLMNIVSVNSSNYGWAEKQITTVKGQRYVLGFMIGRGDMSLQIGNSSGGGQVYALTEFKVGTHTMEFTAQSTVTYLGWKHASLGIHTLDSVTLKTVDEEPGLEVTRTQAGKLHPYIGKVSGSYRDRRNDIYGDPIILKKGHCSIGIFGGSVAYYYALYERTNKEKLLDHITKKYKDSSCKTFTVLNFAAGGHLAPMQMHSFIRNIDLIDMGIIIDGFNELSIPILDPEYYPIDYPAWYYYMDYLYLDEKLKEVSSLNFQFYKKSYELIDNYSESSLAENSHLIKLFLHRILLKLGEKLMGLQEEMTKMKLSHLGKTFPNLKGSAEPYEKIRQDIWKKSVRIIHQTAKTYSIPVVHILQPLPFPETKDLTPSEAKYMKDHSQVIHRRHYKYYSQLISELAEEGVIVHNSKMIFSNFKGTAYKDPVHLTNDGNAIFSQYVVNAIETSFPRTLTRSQKLKIDYSPTLK